MKLTDNYTYETVEKHIYADGVDLLEGFMKNAPALKSGYIKYDGLEDRYIMTTETLNFWCEFADGMNEDISVAAELAKEYGRDKVEQIIREEWKCDSYANSRAHFRRAFERIKAL